MTIKLSGVKPSTEFWMTLVTQIALGYGVTSGRVPPEATNAAVYTIGGLAGLYAVARGASKRGT